MTYKFEYGGPNAEAKLAATVMTMSVALRTTLETVAEKQGGLGPWFDELEQVLIRQAKGAITEGIAIQTEAEVLQFAVDILKAQLDAARGGLIGKDK